MEPYYNANIDIYMVSYAMPVYDNGDLVGVIGMDIDFTAFEEIAGSFQVYSSSGSVLCSQDFGKIYYQKDAFFGDSIEDEIASIPPDGEQAEQLRFMKVGREKYAAYFKTLDNQMQLVTYVSASETNKQVYYIVVVGFAVFCLIFLGSLQLSLGVSKKITKPLYDIMEATTQYANGNWNAKVSCETDDEIGMLANNIGMMADKTRDYISQIRYMAKYDALTGVRNRNDYQQHVERYVEEALHSDGKLALVVMDVNNLKTANDSLGHETGDALLRSAGKLICEAFSPSPVYRIGGDEFAVIVHGADCDTVDQKLRVFQEQVNSVAAIGNITDVCVASGMAKLGIDGDTYDAVFKAADERMYRDKASLKAKKEGRLGKA